MKRLLFTAAFVALQACSVSSDPADHKISDPQLNTGKFISPPILSRQDVGNMPINLILSPDGKYALATDMGYFESLWSIRTSDGKGVSHVDYSNLEARAKAAATAPAGEDSEFALLPPDIAHAKAYGLYYGLAISDDHMVYAAQGNYDGIAVLHLGDDGSLTPASTIQTKPHDFPTGLALDHSGHLFVSNNASGLGPTGNPFDYPGSVSIYDRTSGNEIGRYIFSASQGGTSNFPLGITAKSDGSRVYVASERDNAVYILDTHDAANPQLLATVSTGTHPTAVLLSRDQSQLYVANSLSDTISIIDTNTNTNTVSATVLLRPEEARNLPGVSPVALALSPDGKSLYAALGDMNAVAVVDSQAAVLQGYIPSGWYPSALAVTSDGQRLLIANAKGTRVMNPNNRTDPHDPKKKSAYVLNLLEGNVVTQKIPDDSAELQKSTAEVLAENRLDMLKDSVPVNPLAGIGLASGNIKHIVYIIKENRTYDQVLGDEPAGNGDKSLLLFGKDITPNQHAIAERFALFDNLYACGEVSGDGWAWSTQGMADAYVERNVPYNYSTRGRSFDFEGQVNGLPSGGVPSTDSTGKPLAKNPLFKNGTSPIPDVASTGRYIWDTARDAGVSVRNYGFLLYTATSGAGIQNGPDNYPVQATLQPGGHDLAGVSDQDYRRFDLDYADSDAATNLASQLGDKSFLYREATYGQSQMPSRFSEWNREFQMMLQKDPTGNAVPNLTMIRLPNDHTDGAKSGGHSPRSMVADNDYALGKIVQSISNSPIWSSTAIFVIEDDAQSGIDHVDAHRTIGYVISPWIKRNSVDHHFYNTDGMLKTIELLLGLPPLSQYDAVADPILDWDTAANNSGAFKAILPNQQLITELNPKASDLHAGDLRLKMATDSDAMDFSHADAAPADRLDEITWQTIKGPNSKIPIHVEAHSPAVG